MATAVNGPEFAETSLCVAYSLDGIPFVPHYRTIGLFVAPGGKRTATETELKRLGAARHDRKLWVRKWALETGLQAKPVQEGGQA